MNTNGPLRQFQERFERHAATCPDFSHATADDPKNDRALLVVFRDGINDYACWVHQAHGADTSIRDGERDRDRIQEAELS